MGEKGQGEGEKRATWQGATSWGTGRRISPWGEPLGPGVQAPWLPSPENPSVLTCTLPPRSLPALLAPWKAEAGGSCGLGILLSCCWIQPAGHSGRRLAGMEAGSLQNHPDPPLLRQSPQPGRGFPAPDPSSAAGNISPSCWGTQCLMLVPFTQPTGLSAAPSSSSLPSCCACPVALSHRSGRLLSPEKWQMFSIQLR